MNVRNALHASHFKKNKDLISNLSESCWYRSKRGAHFPCEGKAQGGPKHFKFARFILPQSAESGLSLQTRIPIDRAPKLTLAARSCPPRLSSPAISVCPPVLWPLRAPQSRLPCAQGPWLSGGACPSTNPAPQGSERDLRRPIARVPAFCCDPHDV
jgi:hypothetical protein